MAFDISALDAFKDELAGGDFFKLVAEGTLADAFNTYEVSSKGTQQLNVNSTTLNFTTLDVNGTAQNAWDTYNSTPVYDKVDLVVDGNAAQGYVRTSDLFGSYAGNSVSSWSDEGAIRGFAQDVAAQTRLEYAKRLYTGFGLGSPTNGLTDIAANMDVDVTNTTISKDNIIDIIELAIANFLAISGNDALEGRELTIVMTPAHYRALRAAYRTANFFDAEITSESGMFVTRWLDNAGITIYADPAYTGAPMIMYQDSIYVGTVAAGFNIETPEVWYNQDMNSIGFRVSMFGGVQAIESTHIRTINLV